MENAKNELEKLNEILKIKEVKFDKTKVQDFGVTSTGCCSKTTTK